VKHVPNPDADVCKEVLEHLVAEHGYGNRDSRTGWCPPNVVEPLGLFYNAR
jgi:hypothetical protein